MHLLPRGPGARKLHGVHVSPGPLQGVQSNAVSSRSVLNIMVSRPKRSPLRVGTVCSDSARSALPRGTWGQGEGSLPSPPQVVTSPGPRGLSLLGGNDLDLITAVPWRFAV